MSTTTGHAPQDQDHGEGHGHRIAHVTLGDHELEVPEGPTEVRQLKSELGVPEADVLYLKHGHDKRILGDDEVLDVKDGMHFEAIPGGGVS